MLAGLLLMMLGSSLKMLDNFKSLETPGYLIIMTLVPIFDFVTSPY